jgi:uncharacterized protein (TIGR02001 family)
MIRRLIPLALTIAAVAPAAPAAAAELDPGIDILIATRGVSKGLTQTDGPQIVVRPELGWGHLYFGAYAKNVTSPTSEGEGGPLVGIRFSAAGFDLGASATYKRLISPVGDQDGEALELAANASRRIGPANARLSVTWSPDDLGSTGRTIYWEGAATYRLFGQTTLGGSLGRRERDGGPDYTAFNLGVTQTIWRGISADLRWYDTNRSGLGDAFEGRLIGALRTRF